MKLRQMCILMFQRIVKNSKKKKKKQTTLFFRNTKSIFIGTVVLNSVWLVACIRKVNQSNKKYCDDFKLCQLRHFFPVRELQEFLHKWRAERFTFHSGWFEFYGTPCLPQAITISLLCYWILIFFYFNKFSRKNNWMCMKFLGIKMKKKKRQKFCFFIFSACSVWLCSVQWHNSVSKGIYAITITQWIVVNHIVQATDLLVSPSFSNPMAMALQIESPSHAVNAVKSETENGLMLGICFSLRCTCVSADDGVFVCAF